MDSLPSCLGRLEIALSAKNAALKTSPNRYRQKRKPSLLRQTVEPSASNQPISTLIHKIPYDIRSQIYQQLLLPISPVLHINYLAPRKCQPCVLSKPDYTTPPHKRALYLAGDAWGVTHSQCFVQATTEGENSNFRDILNFARSCWVLHHEVTHTIYTHFKFHIINIQSSHHFLTQTPPHHLAYIRSLHLSWLVTLPLSRLSNSSSDRYIFDHDRFSFLPKHGSRKQQVSHFKAYQVMRTKQREICKYLNRNTLPNLSSLKIFIYQEEDQLDRNINMKQIMMMLKGVTISPDVFEVQLPPWKMERSRVEEDWVGGDGEGLKGVQIKRRSVREEGYAIGHVRVEHGRQRSGLLFWGLFCPWRVLSNFVRGFCVGVEEKRWV